MLTLRRLYLALVQYFFTLLALFDPISSGSNNSPKNGDFFLGVPTDQLYSRLKQSSFFWPLISLVLFEVIGIVGLEVDSSGGFRWWSQLATSPAIVVHQIIPRAVWPQIDLFFYIAINGASLAAAALYQAPLIAEAYRFSMVKETEEEGENSIKMLLMTKNFVFKQTLDEKSSATILRYRSALYRYFYLLVAIFVAVLLSFYYLMVYLKWRFPLVSPLAALLEHRLSGGHLSCDYRQILIVLIINFFRLFAPVFYGMPLIMVTTSVVVILVQQRASLEKIRQLNVELFGSSRKGLTQQKVYRLKRSFNRLAFTTVHLSGTVAAYSRQWSAYLSAIVPVQVLTISNLSFVLFFAGGVSITLKYMFLFADLALTVLLFAQMNSCAQVVRHQGAFAKHFVR
ncbi:hypothetical protein TYRP_015276 [Tyrophagus putrescentiae]|nr:hypothetical protein TYRP_015276 [Tyrophagus putrescentiae]